MPHQRSVKTGSFAGHFDELIKHFRPERPPAKPKRKSSNSKRKPLSPARLNRLLLDSGGR